jgi:hypothetical protein
VARALKNTKDTAVYPGSGYQGPISSSEMFFSDEGGPAWGMTSGPWGLAPLEGEVACLVVSRHLRDLVQGVADSTSHPLNGLASWNIHTCRGPRMPDGLAVTWGIGCCRGTSSGRCSARVRHELPSVGSLGLWRAPEPRAEAVSVLGLRLTLTKGCARAYPMGIAPERSQGVGLEPFSLGLDIPLC